MWAVLAVLVPEQAGSIRKRQADPKVPGKKQLQLLVVKLTKNVALCSANTYYCAHLNTGHVWYSNGPNMFSCQMVQFLNAICKPKQPNLWKMDQMSAILLYFVLVQYYSLFSWSADIEVVANPVSWSDLRNFGGPNGLTIVFSMASSAYYPVHGGV